jgi:hypothetical protein
MTIIESGAAQEVAGSSMARKYSEYYVILHALLPKWKKESLKDEPNGTVANQFAKDVIKAAEKGTNLL